MRHNSAAAATAATTEVGTTNIAGRAASSQAQSERDRTGIASSAAAADIELATDSLLKTRIPTHSPAITSVEVLLTSPYE